MTDLLMQLIADYGLIVLSASIVLACLALPLPSSILLVLSGAFVGSGDLDLLAVVIVAFSSAVIGDQIAYFIGAKGGDALEARLANSPKRSKSIHRAKAFSAKWGGIGVFLSRWLVAPIGPWVNYASGMGDYHWRGFTFWAFLGEIIWVGGYLSLGIIFSANAEAVAELLTDISWFLLGALGMFVLGRKLLKNARKAVKK
ncbi:MAG: DedA family protein [Rhodobacteraceae bacterium]|nr:DedA family protein [Paracoccaceae bacterium]